jgi:hypothetical protein
MLKLVCSYARKGPADEEYSSRQYHAGLEMELPEGLTLAQLDAKVHETFAQLQQAVEAELNGTAAKSVAPQNGNGQATRPPANNTGTARGNGHVNGNGRKISNAQAKFALDLSRKAGMKLADLDAMVRDGYGVGSVYELGAGQASALIETLKGRKAA